MQRHFTWLFIASLTLALHASGCGDDGKIQFVSLHCGNGVLDDNEECDDGNVSNSDSCLTTCVFATCGDAFVFKNGGTEQCDNTNLDGQTCASLGFTSGKLRCTSSCQFDTSQCTGTGSTPVEETPTPQVTPTTVGPTASSGETPTGDPTPTATATPGGGGATCSQGSQITITVTIGYDATGFPDVSGATTTVLYPAGLDIPGNQSTTDQTRATNLTGKSGFFNISDQSSTGGNTDDQVVIGLIATPQVIPPGNFASVTFDCAAGTSVPTPGSFTCTPDLSTNSGTTVTGASCAVASVSGP